MRRKGIIREEAKDTLRGYAPPVQKNHHSLETQ
jgi:hypothetical protein